MKKNNILAGVMISAAMAMGLVGDKVSVKKATVISRNWKEDQNKDDKLSALKKAQIKRERKRLKKERDKIRSGKII